MTIGQAQQGVIVAGVDLGATHMQVGIVADSGSILARSGSRTHRQEGFEGVLDRIAAQIDRVLRRQGHLIWYDFFLNPKNADTVSMTLRRVRELFAGWPIIYRARVMPAAPLARMVERVWGGGLRLMSRLKVLNFHYLLVLQKP